MSATEIVEQIRKLPPEERREVIEHLRDEFAEVDDELTPEQAADSVSDVAKHVTCFASTLPSISRTSILRALVESFSNSKQQSSPGGTSGTTSSVSKPAGSTSLIQDVGGISATKNGSSVTLQFAPGDLVENLGTDGVFDFCPGMFGYRVLPVNINNQPIRIRE